MSLLAAFSVTSQAQAPTAFRKGEVVVELKPGGSIEAVNARNSTTTRLRIYGTNFYRLAVPAGKKDKKWRKRLAKDPDVLSAALNPLVLNPINVFARSIANFPGDKARPGQLSAVYLAQLDSLNLKNAQLRSRGEGVILAVIDTGVYRAHSALASKLFVDPRDGEGNGIDDDGDGLIDDAQGWDFVDNDNDPSEGFGDPQTTVAGHGTFISGLITLVAPSARIIPVRAFDSSGFSDAFTVAAAIKYAADHGAHVINLSLGSSEASTVLHDAIIYARQRGSVLIAAMGNDNRSTDNIPQFPASWSTEAMGVAAIDLDGRKAVFSNFGGDVSVAAPGVALISAFPGAGNDEYATWSGTSFAAPLASAEAALILGAEPRHPNARGVIESTAISVDGLNPGLSGKLGRGRINPLGALQSLSTVSNLHSETKLISTGVEPQAEGKAEITVSGTEQQFEIEAAGLRVSSAYKVIVDGNMIIDGRNSPRAVTNNFGGLKIEFSTSPGDSHAQIPALILPVQNIKHVELRDSLDRIVLQNDFGSSGNGGVVVEKEVTLLATGVVPGAQGDAKAEVEPEREKLRVRADGLTAGDSYAIVVDGQNIGTGTAQSGFLRITFATDGSGDRPLPSSLTPVTSIQHVELRNIGGQVVLQGDFQPGGGTGGDDEGGGGGGDDGGGGGGDDGSGGSGGGTGPGGGDMHKDADFIRTGVDSDANGEVKISSTSSGEKLEIRAKDLDRDTPYEIFVDGFALGNFSTDSEGEVRVKFSSEPEDLPLPPQVRPVTGIRRVEIRTQAGTLVLFADLP
jgi:subtilisin family serine protease